MKRRLRGVAAIVLLLGLAGVAAPREARGLPALVPPAPGPGQRLPKCFGKRATIAGQGQPGRDGYVHIEGTGGADVIVGTSFSDLIHGHGGPDVICARDGDDIVYGNDPTRYGGCAQISYDSDAISGGDGNDVLVLGCGPRGGTIYGEDGNDYLVGSFGPDALRGGAGIDYLVGLEGDDRLFGGAGDDLLEGNVGADTLNGQAGDDTCADPDPGTQFSHCETVYS